MVLSPVLVCTSQADLALKEWCTDLTLRRYLVARNWNVAHAKKMLLNTLEWQAFPFLRERHTYCLAGLVCYAISSARRPCLRRRKTYKPHEIRWDDIAKEATGKLFVMPRTDKHGRTVVILRPR